MSELWEGGVLSSPLQNSRKDIFNLITSKDGLLFGAIEGLLALNRIAFQPNVKHGKDIEVDIQILTKNRQIITDIIEVKMFKTDRTDDTKISNLRNGLKKFMDARQKLIAVNKGFENVRYHFVTNLQEDNLYGQVRDEFKSELGKMHLSLCDQEGMYKYIIDDFLNRYK